VVKPVKEIVPEEVMPVAPVIAPAPEILIFAEDKKLLYPVPNLIPLNTLFAMPVTFEKLMPFTVFVPEVVLPVNDTF